MSRSPALVMPFSFEKSGEAVRSGPVEFAGETARVEAVSRSATPASFEVSLQSEAAPGEWVVEAVCRAESPGLSHFFVRVPHRRRLRAQVRQESGAPCSGEAKVFDLPGDKP